MLPSTTAKHTKTNKDEPASTSVLARHRLFFAIGALLQDTQKQISMNLPLLLYSQGIDSSLLLGRYSVLLFGPEVVRDKMALRPAYSTTAREPLVSMLSLNSNHTKADEEMNHDRVTVAHEAYPEHPSR